MSQFTMFRCDTCKEVYENEEYIVRCENFHLVEKQLEVAQTALTMAQKNFDDAQEKLFEACPKHVYKPTGNTSSEVSYSDTKYTSYEMKCRLCGRKFWSA